MKKQPAKPDMAPFIVGTGLLALDVVVSKLLPEATRLWAGGTFGNVLVILRYLGWRAAPIARLRDGTAATKLTADLRRWDVSTQFITMDNTGSTPVIVQRIGRTPGGEPFHSFSWRCPNCGARLPNYKPVLASDAEALTSRVDSPSVFFFDRLSRGALVLARACAEKGAAVVFEPSSVGNPALFREAWEVAHVIKYSHERLQELPTDLEGKNGPRLQVETLGHEGLRFRTRLRESKTRPWQHLPPIPAKRVRDTAGAGDWCTAGIISRLCPGGAAEFDVADDASVRESVRYGQALATWTCGFEGARGGMYEVDKTQFNTEIAALLGSSSKNSNGEGSQNPSGQECLTCICPACERPRKRLRQVRIGVTTRR
jgi:fructokinase